MTSIPVRRLSCDLEMVPIEPRVLALLTYLIERREPADGRLDLIDLIVTRAVGHLALAAYLPDGDAGDCRGYGIMVLTIADGQVTTITGFPDPDLFPIFGLPTTMA